MSTIVFTSSGVWRGFKACLPIAIGVMSYGLVYGMLAQNAGLSIGETLMMSLFVFAGISQIIATELWHYPLPVTLIVATTFIVNFRHALMGASLHPWFKNLSPLKSYGSLFFCVDEGWALTVRNFNSGEKDAEFLLGTGFAVYICWFLASFLGFHGGVAIPNPKTLGLDFPFTAVFLTMITSMWKGREDLFPWIVAAVVAVISEKLLPGKWFILTGALAGTLFEVFRDGNQSSSG